MAVVAEWAVEAMAVVEAVLEAAEVLNMNIT